MFTSDMRIAYGIILLIMSMTVINVNGEEEPIIRFDKSDYSPFDEVIITVKYDAFNRDPNSVDKIVATLSTSERDMKIEVVETESNNGLFLTTIKLSPNFQRYPGDLQVKRGDTLRLSIEFGNAVFSENAKVNFHQAKIELDKQVYKPREEAILRIIEPDANKNPYLMDAINITISTDNEEIVRTINETGVKSGIFETSIDLGRDIEVDENDILIISYTDDTLPLPAELNRDLVSTESSTISSRVIITEDSELFSAYIKSVEDTADTFAKLVSSRGGLSNLLVLDSVEPFTIINNDIEGESSASDIARLIVDSTAFTTGDRAPISINEVSRIARVNVEEYKQGYKDALTTPREWSKDETKILLNPDDLILKINWKSLNKDITTIAALDDGVLEFEPMMYFTSTEPIVGDASFMVKNYFGNEVVDANVSANIDSSDSCEITSNPNAIPKVDVWTAPLWISEHMSKTEIFAVSKCLTDPEKDFECASIESVIVYGAFVPNWRFDRSNFDVAEGNLPISSNDIKLRLQACPTTPIIETVRHAGSVFNIVTHQNNINIESITVDESSTALVFTFKAQQDGVLEVTLPRELIDSRSNDADTDFVVMIDGKQREYEEIATNESERSIRVSIPAGSNELKIIGTQVVPEFSVLVLITLAVTISLVIATTRFKGII